MGALVLLLFLASSLYTCQSQAPSVESALNEIFDEGTLGNMDVSGSVKMETGTDLSFTVNTHIKNNGFGLNTDFSITDSRCDFRKVKLSTKSEVTLPDDVTRILNLLGVPSTITVADETMEVNFLPENA